MSVAKAYAKALFEAAQEAKLPAAEINQIEKQLETVVKALEQSKEARVALFGPATAAKDKVSVVEEIARRAQLSKLVSNFLVLLARKQRLTLIGEVQEAFGQVRLEAEGGILGHLQSAEPMEPSDLEELSRAFSGKLGKPVAFRTTTEPSLLAGMKVTVNGVTYDGTLRSQLQRLRDQLVYGSSATH